jgi:hypothetical protein
MKYATEMNSGAMIYIQGFIKTGSAIQELMDVRDTQTTWRSHMPTSFFVKIRKLG